MVLISKTCVGGQGHGRDLEHVFICTSKVTFVARAAGVTLD